LANTPIAFTVKGTCGSFAKHACFHYIGFEAVSQTRDGVEESYMQRASVKTPLHVKQLMLFRQIAFFGNDTQWTKIQQPSNKRDNPEEKPRCIRSFAQQHYARNNECKAQHNPKFLTKCSKFIEIHRTSFSNDF
jgi:hypothetical protein